MSKLDPSLLREIVQAVGETALARLIGRTARALRYWTREERSIPQTLPHDVAMALDRQIAELRELRRRLR